MAIVDRSTKTMKLNREERTSLNWTVEVKAISVRRAIKRARKKLAVQSDLHLNPEDFEYRGMETDSAFGVIYTYRVRLGVTMKPEYAPEWK